jgi:TetR/AcrR family transcriptional regulator, transcriptional repressor of bet genes
MGRKSNTDQRREEIIKAFMSVVANKGYAGASIQEIAKAAGLTPGLIHYHFKSKQEILITLFAQLEALVNQRMAARMDSLNEAAPLAALEALIDAFLAVDDSSNLMAVKCWTMISAEAVNNPELSQQYQRVLRKQLTLIEKLVKQATGKATVGKGQQRKIQSIAAAILAAIQGSFLLASVAPGMIPPGSAASSIKLMAKGLLQNG